MSIILLAVFKRSTKYVDFLYALQAADIRKSQDMTLLQSSTTMSC